MTAPTRRPARARRLELLVARAMKWAIDTRDDDPVLAALLVDLAAELRDHARTTDPEN